MKKSAPSFLIIALTCLSPASVMAADGLPASLPSDSRMKVLMYDESDVYTITVKYGFQTHIVFAPGEEIEMISVGDRSMWQIIPTGNRLFIRAMVDNVTTNMTVITNQRSYQFDLKSVGEDSDANIYVARFTYPEDAPRPMHVAQPDIAPPPVKSAPVISDVYPDLPPTPLPPAGAETAPAVVEPPAPVTVASAPEPTRLAELPAPTPAAAPVEAPAPAKPSGQNFNYTYTGPDELAPSEVYDDGKTTYFKYRVMNQALPNVYLVDAKGRETPVAHYTKNGMMAVDAISPRLALKNSNGTVFVYNEMLKP